MKLFKLSIRTFRRRFAIEWPLDQLLEERPESFETLDPITALSLPVAGSILLMLIFSLLSKTNRRVGVIHVIERLARH